jgi:hypothetical protein
MHRVPQHTDAEIAQQSTGRVVSKKKIKLTQ